MARPLEPRKSKVAVPLPDDATLTPDIRQRLQQLPALNNLRMFANVPQCFLSITSLINQLFHAGTIDPKLREYMYLRIAIKYGLYYEYRHNLLFSEQLGMTDGELAALRSDGPVDRLSADGNLVCAAAEEITERFSVGDEMLTALLDRFGTEGACEIILLVSWFNLLIRYVESTRVPYEKDLGDIIKGGAPLELK
ncbi:MAG: hypothetical protein WB822_16750 [Rhodoplanes sp.]